MKYFIHWHYFWRVLSGEALLLLLTFFLSINIVTDSASGGFRGWVWVLTFCSTIVSPQTTLAIIIGSAACWDIPLLRLGFPNQFITDVMILGYASGFLTYQKLRSNGRNITTDMAEIRESAEDWYQPIKIWSYLCFSLVSGFLITSTQELASISAGGLGIKNFLLTIGERGFDWAIEAHLISRYGSMLGLGTLLILQLCLQENRSFDRTRKTRRICFNTIILSSIINFTYALAQLFEHPWAPQIYTVDIGGLTQNGNHLSYVGLLTLVALAFELGDSQQRLSSVSVQRLLTVICGIISGFGALIIGYGRASWVGLASGSIVCLVIYVSGRGISRRLVKPLCVTVVAVALSLIGFYYSGPFIKIPVTYSLATSEFFELFSQPSLYRIFSAGGRANHYAAAWNDFINNLWVGIGYDGFFMRHPFFLEIHSLPLKLLAECGLLGGITFIGILAALIAVSIRGIIARQSTGCLKIAVAIGGIWAIFIPLLADAFLSFRGIATLASGVMFFLVRQILEESFDTNISMCKPWIKFPRFLSLSTSASILFVSAILLSTVFGAPTIPITTSQYTAEKDEMMISFNWRSLITELPFKSGNDPHMQCLKTSLKSPLSQGRYQLRFARFSRDDVEYMKIKNLTFIKSQFASEKTPSLEFKNSGSTWQRLCVCLKSPLGEFVPTMFVENGDILSFSQFRPNRDLRFITLGVGKITPMNADEPINSCASI